MLTPTDITRGRTSRRAPPSVRQQYHEYVLQRIEAYKDGMTRDQLMALGGEAAQELQADAESQLLLTEVLMNETVDRLIHRRLGLPSERKWRRQFQPRRAAQREPVHWGIHPSSALVRLLNLMEPDDEVLAIGSGIQAEVHLLLAWDTQVTFLDQELAQVEQMEAKIRSESLGIRFGAYVASLGDWWPQLDGGPFCMVMLDAGTLASLPYARRQALLSHAQDLTGPEGVHVILPGGSAAAPEAYVSHYGEWERDQPSGERKGRAGKSRGVVLRRRREEVDDEAEDSSEGDQRGRASA